jgi:FAD/FMN-containing dehydrogenase
VIGRRKLVTATAAAWLGVPATCAAAPRARVRPSDPAWPSDAAWEQLNRAVGGRLSRVHSPLAACDGTPDTDACRELFRHLKNPYAIGDDPGLSQTTGWIDAWTFQPSTYVVAAESAADVAAAVTFARENNLRLVVKGGAHSYLGTSNAADSLLVWTRRMNRVETIDAFVPTGLEGKQDPVPAVSIGAGAIWRQAYDAVVTKAGRYVQGGGCLTVGVAGLLLGGGFGTYSKTYGTAAASLLEAEIVTADGAIRTVNAARDPDLFWALKGGGGGTFGVVTRLTLRTHDLPEYFGIAYATVQAASPEAFRRLVGQFVSFYAESMLNPHWGEIVKLFPRDLAQFRMEFAGLDQARAAAVWQPFWDWIKMSPADYTFTLTPVVRHVAARDRWNPAFFRANAPDAIRVDDRPGAPADNIFWSGNLAEAGHFLHGFESRWLPASLLSPDQRDRLADALFAASRRWVVELHFQKGLAGAPDAAIAATRDTATNPAVLDAFVLAIIASEGPPAYPGLAGHEPNFANARRDAARIGEAMAELRRIAPDGGSYVNESGYFEADWQRSFWGDNYARLLAIKQRYDPDGLFFVRHGVGSDAWTDDGFTRLRQ